MGQLNETGQSTKDCISRQAAIHAICTECHDGICDMYPCGEIKALEALPSAQPEVTEEAVKEYCHKRCLCIVDSALLEKYGHSEGLYIDGRNDGYREGWKDGREALRREIWEDGRDRLD